MFCGTECHRETEKLGVMALIGAGGSKRGRDDKGKEEEEEEQKEELERHAARQRTATAREATADWIANRDDYEKATPEHLMRVFHALKDNPLFMEEVVSSIGTSQIFLWGRISGAFRRYLAQNGYFWFWFLRTRPNPRRTYGLNLEVYDISEQKRYIRFGHFLIAKAYGAFFSGICKDTCGKAK